MKKLGTILIAIAMAMPLTAIAEEGIKFNLSAAVARKMSQGKSERAPGERGDATGPFKKIGGVSVNAAGLHNVQMDHASGTTISYLGIDDPGIDLQIDFFVNEKGNGYGVVHRRPAKEAKPVEEEKEEVIEDERPYAHVELCNAAEFAIYNGNTALLGALLKAGLSVNESLDLETKWTPLHYSAIHNKPRVAKMLIEHGADLESRGKYGSRPIDDAYEDKAFDLCEVLRKPEKAERKVSGFPRPLLDELFNGEKQNRDLVRFLALNGKDPDDEILKYFRRHWPNVRVGSRSEEVAKELAKEEGGKTRYRDKKTKDYGWEVQVTIKSIGEGAYEWRHRIASGPFLAGGGVGGKISRKYGYWLKHDEQSWDE